MALSNEEIFDKEITLGDESIKSYEYTVEELIKERWSGARKFKEYLIKWEGFSSDDNTWEPAENLYGCPEKWQLYKEKKLNKSRKRIANNEDDEDFIFDDACGIEINKNIAKLTIKREKRSLKNISYQHSKRLKNSTKSESEDSCEKGSFKKDELKNKIKKKKETKIDRETKSHKISKTADKIDKNNEDNKEIAEHLLTVTEKEKRKQEFAVYKSKDSSDEYEDGEIRESDNEDMEIANQDIKLKNNEETLNMDEDTIETDPFPPKKETKCLIQSESKPDIQDDRRSRMAKIKKTVTTSNNFVGKWWNNLELLPDEELLRIPLEKKDPKKYIPIKPINKGSKDIIRVAISTDKNYGLDKWAVESIVGILNESGIDHQSLSDMETDLNTNSFALVKFIGITVLHKVPIKLLEKTEQYNKYLNYSTTKLNIEKRGVYWNKELEKPQHWMSLKALKAFEAWKLVAQN